MHKFFTWKWVLALMVLIPLVWFINSRVYLTSMYYPEPGSKVVHEHPGEGGMVQSTTAYESLDGKIGFSMSAAFEDVGDPRVSISITSTALNYIGDKIELDCSNAALIIKGRRYSHSVRDGYEREKRDAEILRQAHHLQCIKELTLYDKSGVYVRVAELLFWPGERLGESFSIELPIVKNHPQMSKPLIVKFVREMRSIRGNGGV